MNRPVRDPTLRLPPAPVVRALWVGVALLVAVGLASVAGRGSFPGDFARRAEPARRKFSPLSTKKIPGLRSARRRSNASTTASATTR